MDEVGGRRSGFGKHTLVAAGAPGEADRQMRSRDLGGVAMCVTRARVAPRAGVEGRERQAAGVSSVQSGGSHGGGGGVSSVVVAAVAGVVGGLPWRGRQTSVRLVFWAYTFYGFVLTVSVSKRVLHE